VGKADIDGLVHRAHASLKPRGTLIVHDFMVNEDLIGSASAALWMLVLVSSRSRCASRPGICPA
jgi:hypothetical protein